MLNLKLSQIFIIQQVVDLMQILFFMFQFLGTFKNGLWHGGILEKVVRDSYLIWYATKIVTEDKKSQDRKNVKIQDDLPATLRRWLVLDGDLDPSWTEGMKTLLDDSKCLSLGNGERIYLQGGFL